MNTLPKGVISENQNVRMSCWKLVPFFSDPWQKLTYIYLVEFYVFHIGKYYHRPMDPKRD